MKERSDSQLAIIRRHLLQGKSITPIDALTMCGCFRLSAIIHTLRHKEEYPILMNQPEITDGKHYARYWIDKAYFRNQLDIQFMEGGCA